LDKHEQRKYSHFMNILSHSSGPFFSVMPSKYLAACFPFFLEEVVASILEYAKPFRPIYLM